MKLGAALVGLLLLTASVGAGEDTPEAVWKDLLNNNKEMADLLATVKDKASAQAARAKLLELDKKLNALFLKLDALEKKDPKKLAEVTAKYKDQALLVRDFLGQEATRVSKIPDAERVLEDIVMIAAIRLGKVARARAEVAALTQAVQGYRATQGTAPPSLQALAEKDPKGGAPLVKAAALVDPWGRPYRYDITGPHHKGEMPDIWSEGPRPGEPDSIIGNWSQEKKK